MSSSTVTIFQNVNDPMATPNSAANEVIKQLNDSGVGLGGSGGIDITDGTNTVDGATSLTVTGGTVGGTSPNATLDIVGGSGVPLPFVGTAPVVGWTRPSLEAFDTWLNQGDATASDGDGGLPLSISTVVGDANTTSNVAGLFKSIGSAPYTITCAFAGSSNLVPSRETGANAWIPIMLQDADSNVAAFIWYSIGYVSYVALVTYMPAYPVGSGQTLVSTEDYGFSFITYFEWFRLENDGTNLVGSVSDEGQDWQQVFSIALTDVGISDFVSAGFGMDLSYAANAAASQSVDPATVYQSAKLWQWVEG